MNQPNFSNIKSCGQRWEDMPALDCGRLCGKCNKTIHDFRQMSTFEVAFLHAQSAEPLCGIYREDQLHPSLPKTVQKPRTAWKAFGLSLLGLFLAKAGNTQSDTLTLQPRQELYPPHQGQPMKQEMQQEVKDSFYVHGQVTDINGQALIGVTVHVAGSVKMVVTDANGFYQINVSDEVNRNSLFYLDYSYVGYGRRRMTFKAEDFKHLSTEEGPTVIMENYVLIEEQANVIAFSVAPAKPKTFWQKVGRFFRFDWLKN